MRAVLILVALGWLMSLPWIAVLSYLVLVVAAIVIMWLLSVSIERRAISPRHDCKIIDHNYVAALEDMVTTAEAEVETLRAELQRLRSATAASEADPKAALHGRVGLSPAAPEWLVAANRIAA